MKALTDRTCKTEWGLVGGGTTVCRQRFEIEAKDVGHVRPHFNGFNHSSYTIEAADVGRIIEKMSDHSGWFCWGFIINNPVKES